MVYMHHRAVRRLVLVLLIAVCSAAFAQGTGGDISLEPLFSPDPQALEYLAGGDVDAAEAFGQDLNGDACVGLIADVPDHVLTLEPDEDGAFDSFGYLRIFVESEADTTLVVVNEETGDYLCNDDTFGLNPQVEAEDWPFGAYSIYVGTFTSDEFPEYTIFFSELAAD